MLAAWLVTLHHRFLPSGSFVPRGTVDVVDGAATFTPAGDKLDPEGEGWYQVGLESTGGDWITTSTRAVSPPPTFLTQCFANADARLVIHTTASGRPTSISYTPAGVPNDGSCGAPAGSGLQVALAHPSKVYRYVWGECADASPGLAAPPEVDEGGHVKEPPPEKTFIQKYGLMIAGFMFVLLMNAGAPDPPQEGAGGGGGGGGGAAQ
jgi:hypothetical protein